MSEITTVHVDVILPTYGARVRAAILSRGGQYSADGGQTWCDSPELALVRERILAECRGEQCGLPQRAAGRAFRYLVN